MTRIPPDTTADKTVMLLSTDWFLPYWCLIGIESDKEKQCFQNGCREIVLQLISDASDYYLVNFSAERLDRTRQSLRGLSRRCKLVPAALIALEELLANRSDRDQLQKTAWLFRSLHEEILADREVEPSTKTVLAHIRSKFAFADDLPLEQICLQSTTSWDQYIRSLTPELPASLAHLVSTSLLSIAELRELLSVLRPKEREQLHMRFRALATQRTGLDLERDWSTLVS